MNNYSFEEIYIGQTESFDIKITSKMMKIFKKLTGDTNPLHTDTKYAKKNNFEGKVVYGLLTTAFLSKLVGIYLPGENSLMQTSKFFFVKPVYIRDKLKIVGRVEFKDTLNKVIKIKINIYRNYTETVVRGEMRIGFIEYDK